MTDKWDVKSYQKNRELGVMPNTIMDSRLTNVLDDYLEDREKQVAITTNMELSVLDREDYFLGRKNYRLSHKFPYKRVDISYDTYTPWEDDKSIYELKNSTEYRDEDTETFFIKSTMTNKILVQRLMILVIEDVFFLDEEVEDCFKYFTEAKVTYNFKYSNRNNFELKYDREYDKLAEGYFDFDSYWSNRDEIDCDHNSFEIETLTDSSFESKVQHYDWNWKLNKDVRSLF